jgi:Flp pilus assembly protein TadD
MRARASTAKALCAAAVFLLCAALPVGLVTIRNLAVGNDFVLVSSNGGVNFYIGNNPDHEKTMAIRPGTDWDDLVARPLKKNPEAKPSERSAFFYARSLDYIRSQPLDWIRLTLGKSLTYVTSVEGRRNHDMYFMRRYSTLFSALLIRAGPFAFPLGVILPLAVIGVLRRPRGRDTALLLVYLAAMFAATVAFFVVARYRMTAVPVLIVFAAWGAAETARMVRRRKLAVIALVAGGLAAVVCNANVPGVDRNRRLVDADSHFFSAGMIAVDKGPQEAVPEYERSIRLNPDFYMSRMNYGRMLFDMGRWRDAVEQLRAAKRLDRTSHQADWLLGESYTRLSQYPAALRHYRAAVTADRAYADGLAHVGLEAYERGEYDYAAGTMRIVTSARPGYAQAHHTLGLALFKLGRLNESIAELRRTCELDPGSAATWLALGIAYDKAGQPAQSRAAFRRAVEIGPNDAIRDSINRYLSARDRNKNQS